MATTIEVGLLGLGRIGASLGLALKRYNTTKNAAQHFRITAFDTSPSRLVDGKRMGAFDEQVRTLYDAAKDKALVIMALPYAEVQQAYRDIASVLAPGTVIMDVSPYKAPSLEWAKKALPENTFMIGVTPILNPAYLFDGIDDTAHASADLFDKGGMLVMPTTSTPGDAVELISDLCALLGIQARFADPVEHDGWAAATEGLPALVGLAAFYMLTKKGSWLDAQRQGNPNFGRLIHHLYDTHPDDLRDLLMNNRDGVIRQLDSMVEALRALRDTLAANDRAALEAILEETTDAAHLWVVNRRENKWDKSDSPQIDTSNIASNMFFGSAITKRIRGDKDRGNGKR